MIVKIQDGTIDISQVVYVKKVDQLAFIKYHYGIELGFHTGKKLVIWYEGDKQLDQPQQQWDAGEKRDADFEILNEKMHERFMNDKDQLSWKEDKIVTREKIDMVLDLWFKEKLERDVIQERTGLSRKTIGEILRGDVF